MPKSAFLSLEELLNIAIALVPVPSRCLRYAHLKWLLTVLGCHHVKGLGQDLFASSMWFDGQRLAAACAYLIRDRVW